MYAGRLIYDVESMLRMRDAVDGWRSSRSNQSCRLGEAALPSLQRPNDQRQQQDQGSQAYAAGRPGRQVWLQPAGQQVLAEDQGSRQQQQGQSQQAAARPLPPCGVHLG